jgi:hypothetical protein
VGDSDFGIGCRANKKIAQALQPKMNIFACDINKKSSLKMDQMKATERFFFLCGKISGGGL